MRILIVDDSKLNRVYAKGFIEHSNIDAEIFEAENGEKALEVLMKSNIDIVILDIVMPIMDGVHTLKYIRKNPNWSHVKVLMYSSITEQELLRSCFELGASDFIHKPIEEVEFISRLNNSIRQLKDELELKQYIKEIEKQKSIIMETNLHLIQSEKMAAIGHLAAGVAHEINNPIGFVMSNFEVLKEYINDMKSIHETIRHPSEDIMHEKEINANEISEVFEDIEGIIAETKIGLERVTQIVKSLRNFSRVDFLQEKSYYNINQGIKDTLIIANNHIKYNANVHVTYGEIFEVEAIGNEINQVILNLIMNSVDSIKEKYENEMGDIFIETYIKGDYVVMMIKDHGVGIADGDIKNVFNPFFTTKDVGKGMGLGLSVSYDIVVNKHHGKFEVESDSEEGTIFRMYLPINNKQV